MGTPYPRWGEAHDLAHRRPNVRHGSGYGTPACGSDCRGHTPAPTPLRAIRFSSVRLQRQPEAGVVSDGAALNLKLSHFLLFFYFLGPNRFEPVPMVFLAMWLIHYANRGFIFPYLIRTPRGAKASFSLLVVFTGWIVTTFHGYFNGSFISSLSIHYTLDWPTDPRFVVGLVIHYVSFALNIHSDAVLRNLRSREEVASGAKVYRIPQGGLFRWISCPSYLTELTA